MSYEIYKLIHILSIVVFFGCLGASIIAGRYERHEKIVTGVSSFIILVGGMGLIARIGIKHGSIWPTWLIVKAVIWLTLSALAPILAKRLGRSVFVFYVFVTLAALAAYMAINKPF
jgi:hypothetical protein